MASLSKVTPFTSLPDDDMALLLSASDFFAQSPSRGRSTTLLKDHKLLHAQLPYWLGYGHLAMDWDALIASLGMELEGDKPRRVLDLGCGIAAGWCLSMLGEEGWEGTQFVGLDVAPVLVPMSMLPYAQSSRLSFMQHNFLQRLPFENAKFDYVRVGNIALDVPEPQLQDLADEILRVLVPGGTVAFTVSDLPTIPTPPTLAPALESFFNTSFINTSPSTLIPFLLSTYAQRTLFSRIHRLPLPLSPPTSTPQAPISKRHTLLPSAPPHTARILLHSHALRLESFIPPLLRSSPLSTPDLLLSHALAADPDLPIPRISTVRQELQRRREVEEAISEWRDELVDRAGVARLIEGWEWRCGMDERLEEVLSGVIPVLEEGLREVDAGGEEEGEREFARGQMAFAKREAEMELRAVRRRLGRGAWEEGVLGELVVGEWVAVVP